MPQKKEYKKSMTSKEVKIINTKEDLLKTYVLDKLAIGEVYWNPIIEGWKEIKKQYTAIHTAEPQLQANISYPFLKKIIRNKVAHFMEILLSRGSESFDLNPGEETDERNSELLRHKIVYDLDNAEVERKFVPYLRNYETYGYGVVMVPWRFVQEKQKTGEEIYKDVIVFDGPDITNIDILNFISDPFNEDLTSWKIFKRENVPATYLRQKEKEGVYVNIKELAETSYPSFYYQTSLNIPKDSVELLEYHGLVPQKLIEGKLNDTSDINPFEEDYVWAIITLANRERVIRAAKYPYWCGNIFVPIWKDKLTGENKGIGTGEDLSAIVPMVTNLYNKLTDIVDYVANNMLEITVEDYAGDIKTIMVYPGKIFPVKRSGTVNPINTTAQAASLTPLFNIIGKVEKIIEELTATPPQIMPSADRADIHATYSGLMQMTQQAMLPIQNEIRNNIEPAFKKILEIFYKHNIQFFKKANAIRVLGEERAKQLKITEIKRSDIMLTGNPDFIPIGVSGFLEKMTELRNLFTFLDVALKALAPKLDPMGNPMLGSDGKPIMEMIVDIREIVKRIADRFRFKEIEKLIPSLKIEREMRERIAEAKRKGEEMGKKALPVKAGSIPMPVRPQGGGAGTFSPASPLGGPTRQPSEARGEI